LESYNSSVRNGKGHHGPHKTMFGSVARPELVHAWEDVRVAVLALVAYVGCWGGGSVAGRGVGSGSWWGRGLEGGECAEGRGRG
jgi:hypothetical protein